MPVLHTVEASVHKSMGDGWRVKVSVLDLGMYINGMVVYPPNEKHEEWMVLTPAKPAGRGKYARIIEFNKNLPLWGHIETACIDACNAAILDSADIALTDIKSEEEFKTDLGNLSI